MGIIKGARDSVNLILGIASVIIAIMFGRNAFIAYIIIYLVAEIVILIKAKRGYRFLRDIGFFVLGIIIVIVWMILEALRRRE